MRGHDWTEGVEDDAQQPQAVHVHGLPARAEEDWPMPTPRMLTQPAPLPPSTPFDLGSSGSVMEHSSPAMSDAAAAATEAVEWGTRTVKPNRARPQPPLRVNQTGTTEDTIAQPPPRRWRYDGDEVEWQTSG